MHHYITNAMLKPNNCHWWCHPALSVTCLSSFHVKFKHLKLNLPVKVCSVVSPHWSSSLMSRTLSMDFWAVVNACLAKLDRCDALNQLILLDFQLVEWQLSERLHKTQQYQKHPKLEQVYSTLRAEASGLCLYVRPLSTLAWRLILLAKQLTICWQLS